MISCSVSYAVYIIIVVSDGSGDGDDDGDGAGAAGGRMCDDDSVAQHGIVWLGKVSSGQARQGKAMACSRIAVELKPPKPVGVGKECISVVYWQAVTDDGSSGFRYQLFLLGADQYTSCACVY